MNSGCRYLLFYGYFPQAVELGYASVILKANGIIGYGKRHIQI